MPSRGFGICSGTHTYTTPQDRSALPAQAVSPVYMEVAPLQPVAYIGSGNDGVAARSDALFADPTYDATVTIAGGSGSSNVDTYMDPQSTPDAAESFYMDPQSTPDAAESFYMDASVVDDAAALGSSGGGGNYPTLHVKVADSADLYDPESDLADTSLDQVLPPQEARQPRSLFGPFWRWCGVIWWGAGGGGW